jgi:hypothetical protein
VRREAAVDLLHSLAGPDGIRASRSDEANYGAVFARDAIMAGIAGLLIDDRAIVAGFVRTLEHLRDLQGAEGQIASSYLVNPGRRPSVSFGTAVPRLDAASWYLVGVGLGSRAGALDPEWFLPSARRVVRLLDAIEYNGRHLLYVPPGGNWADEYPYHGYLLSDQVLRAWGLRILAPVARAEEWADKSRRIEAAIERSYWPDRREDGPYPVASVGPTGPLEVFDLAAGALLAAAGLVPERAEPALAWIDARFTARSRLPPAFDPVIDETRPEWGQLARYHRFGFRNRPHEYHNGGVWPIWLGWLALGQARLGRLGDLARLRALVRPRADDPAFRFEEFWHGRSGAALGQPHMAYSATGLVFLDAADQPERQRLLGS